MIINLGRKRKKALLMFFHLTHPLYQTQDIVQAIRSEETDLDPLINSYPSLFISKQLVVFQTIGTVSSNLSQESSLFQFLNLEDVYKYHFSNQLVDHLSQHPNVDIKHLTNRFLNSDNQELFLEKFNEIVSQKVKA